MQALEGRLPDSLFACIGGGSNAIGLFHSFLNDREVAIYGVEAVIADDGTVREESVRDRDEWNVDPLYPERLRPVTIRWVRALIYHQAGRLDVYGLDQELVRETFFNAKSQLVADPGLRKRREFTR